MTERPLDVLIVEDEVLLAAELEFLLDEVGCNPVGHAMSSDEAVSLASQLRPDLALVDVHLRDGPTGVEVARTIHDKCGGVALFMTANVKRLPPDFAGACGVIGKPYSSHGVKTALSYLAACLRDDHAPGPPPLGLELAPAYAERWGLTALPRASQSLLMRLGQGMLQVDARLLASAVGAVAALLSITSFAPQIVKIWREKDALSVSLRTYVVTVAAFSCWIAYGALIQAWPVIASNAACLLMSGAVLVLKWRYGRRRRQGPTGRTAGLARKSAT